jgi:hypothetical protein
MTGRLPVLPGTHLFHGTFCPTSHPPYHPKPQYLMGPFLLTDEFTPLYISTLRLISQFLDLLDASRALHPNHYPFSHAALGALRSPCSVTDVIPTSRISVTAYGRKTPESAGQKILRQSTRFHTERNWVCWFERGVCLIR